MIEAEVNWFALKDKVLLELRNLENTKNVLLILFHIYYVQNYFFKFDFQGEKLFLYLSFLLLKPQRALKRLQNFVWIMWSTLKYHFDFDHFQKSF